MTQLSQLAQVILAQGMQSQTETQILTAMSAAVVLSQDAAFHNYSWVAANYGVPAAESILTALNGASMPGAAQTYCGLGFQLNDSVTQSELTSLATAVPSIATLCNTLKAIGINNGQQWQLWGLSAAPTSTTITSALAELANFIALEAFLNNVFGASVASLLNPTTTTNPTVVSLKTLVANY